MNFEKPNTTKLSAKTQETSNKTSRRGFIRKAFGFGASLSLTKGITNILPDFEKENKIQTKHESVFDRVREPILKDEDFDDKEQSESNENEEDDSSNESREIVDWKDFKKLKPNLSYQERVPKARVENLHLPKDLSKYGATTFEGKIIRTLRYKNITDAVEEKYNLPSGLLLAMIMEESTGVDLLPNARGDGGFGLCHMQGSTAKEYGLKTFKGCHSLVCNGKDSRSCKDDHGRLSNHASILAQYMKIYEKDKKKLVELDERLHVLLNIDAAGRMIASGIAGPKLSGKLANLDPLRRAIARYSGAYNFEKYWEDICKNMKSLEDVSTLKKIEDLFNRKNKDLEINGRRAGFKDYLATCWEQNENYGLEEYKNSRKYLPNNSAQVQKTYRKYI